jgi:hypothetical protein
MVTPEQYDQQCYHLASNLLADHPTLNSTRHRVMLALEIQSTIDDYVRRQWPAPPTPSDNAKAE